MNNISPTREGKIPKFYSSLIVLFLFLPIFQFGVKFFTYPHLYGIQIPTEYKKFSWESFKKEEFQKDIEQYVVKSNALWGYGLQFGNQFYYSFFNQISPKLNNSVLGGSEGQFFQSMYLASFNKSRPLNHKKMEKNIEMLKRLNEDLKKRGKLLVLLISPNTIHLYPDTLPQGYKANISVSEKSSYELFMPEIRKSGILYFDSYDYLKNIQQDTTRYKGRFFQKTGSHLNDIGVCHQVNGVFSSINQKISQSKVVLNCDDFELLPQPLKRDIDLIEIANLYNPENYYEASPKLRVKDVSSETSSKKLRFLMIGSSFLFGVQNALEQNNISDSATLYFYNKTYRNAYHDTFREKKVMSWKKEVENYDVVILETNMSFLSRAGYGFVKQYLSEK